MAPPEQVEQELTQLEAALARVNAQHATIKLDETKLEGQLDPMVEPDLCYFNGQIATLTARLMDQPSGHPPDRVSPCTAGVLVRDAMDQLAKEGLVKARTEACALEDRYRAIKRSPSKHT